MFVLKKEKVVSVLVREVCLLSTVETGSIARKITSSLLRAWDYRKRSKSITGIEPVIFPTRILVEQYLKLYRATKENFKLQVQ